MDFLGFANEHLVGTMAGAAIAGGVLVLGLCMTKRMLERREIKKRAKLARRRVLARGMKTRSHKPIDLNHPISYDTNSYEVEIYDPYNNQVPLTSQQKEIIRKLTDERTLSIK